MAGVSQVELVLQQVRHPSGQVRTGRLQFLPGRLRFLPRRGCALVGISAGGSSGERCFRPDHGPSSAVFLSVLTRRGPAVPGRAQGRARRPLRVSAAHAFPRAGSDFCGPLPSLYASPPSGNESKGKKNPSVWPVRRDSGTSSPYFSGPT